MLGAPQRATTGNLDYGRHVDFFRYHFRAPPPLWAVISPNGAKLAVITCYSSPSTQRRMPVPRPFAGPPNPSTTGYVHPWAVCCAATPRPYMLVMASVATTCRHRRRGPKMNLPKSYTGLREAMESLRA